MEQITEEMLESYPIDESIETLQDVADKHGFDSLGATPGEDNPTEKEMAQYIDRLIRIEEDHPESFKEYVDF